MWLLNAKFAVGVTGIIFDSAGRVLLLRHTFRHRYPWGLLSGWVKGGERLDQALRREAAEETSLQIVVERLVRVRKDRLHLFVEVVYVGRLAGGTFRPSSEVTELCWCDPSVLPPDLHPRHHALIRAAASSRSAAAGAAVEPQN
jgi:ADP-ribose pyrophosphatase YjhB (NUDIX family)